MHSTSPAKLEGVSLGTLFVVATPIGNLEDITLRALKVFADVDLIAAEDTRRTRKILSRYEIKTPLVSFHEHNKKQKASQLVARLRAGASVALVSDAGTPSVSDPGYTLVTSCVEQEIPVTPIPGASAVVAALSVSGLPSDAFTFLGFVPRKAQKRRQLLERIKSERRTIVFYESPKRVLSLIDEIIPVVGNRHAVLARELTKVHEEILRGTLVDVANTLRQRAEVKGECTLVLSGSLDAPDHIEEEVLRRTLVQLRSQGLSTAAIAKAVACIYGLSKKKVYDTMVDMEKNMNREARKTE